MLSQRLRVLSGIPPRCPLEILYEGFPHDNCRTASVLTIDSASVRGLLEDHLVVENKIDKGGGGHADDKIQVVLKVDRLAGGR